LALQSRVQIPAPVEMLRAWAQFQACLPLIFLQCLKHRLALLQLLRVSPMRLQPAQDKVAAAADVNKCFYCNTNVRIAGN
jgi:hypothetical protein